jgi:protein-tyrosine phosphatase
MVGQFISLNPASPDWGAIERAAKALAEGALLAFPTETVYGLAANAANADSVGRLRDVKGRSGKQPFTIHIGRRADCEDFVPELSPLARRLTRKGWPGPLTIVFPVNDPTRARAHKTLSKAGLESVYADASVGVRCPDERIAERLLTAAQAPVIASSANVAGGSPATDGQTIRRELGDKIDIILDAGPTRYQKNSTIVILNGRGYHVLRPGVLDERMIHRLATVSILFVCTGNTCRSPMAAAFCERMLAERLGCRIADLPSQGVIVHSAGTLGVSAGKASREAIEVCRSQGLDISSHVPRGLDVDLLQPADYIFTMARHHLDVVHSLSPHDAAKAVTLHPDGDIGDPIGGTIEDYERTADKIKEALAKRLDEVMI